MEMESELEEIVLETVKFSQHRQESPWVWTMEMTKCLKSLGMALPSPELGQVLVSHLCFRNNHPSLWKFLQQALSSALLHPIHVLSLLSSRVIPHRRSQPEAYRLFLELVSRYALSFNPVVEEASKEKIIKSVDAALQLSETYKIGVLELGHLSVLFLFSIVVGLIDSTFDDMGLPVEFPHIPRGPFGNADDVEDMDVDAIGNYKVGGNEHRELLRKTNSIMAIEVLAKLTETRKAMILLRLVCLNMPEKFNGLLQRLWLFEANKLTSSNMKSGNQVFEKLSANIQRLGAFEYRLNKRQLIGLLIDAGPCKLKSYGNSKSGQSACWVPFDIYMENIMDGRQLLYRSAIAILTETIKSLQAFNRASWQETFLALWLSALRLVQRECEPHEGPIPHLESRLCILLAIVPLAIAKVLEDEDKFCFSSLQEAAASVYMETGNDHQVDGKGQTSRKYGLISSLQVLGQFPGLLCPPASVVGAANVAAAKAVSFISNSKNSSDGLVCGSHSDAYANAGGNMRHLIVEACIARNLIDTSTYFWPSYLSTSVMSLSDVPLVQKSPWVAFMEGEPLNNSLVNLLLMTPAPSLAEIEKLYHIALNGSVEEKSAAAKIICGATLSRGWNIQEHVVHYVVKLLSPPIPSAHTGQRSHLVDYMPMLSAIVHGASSVDNVHVLSLHGVIPEVAASLMPLCEVFGSLMPTSSNKSSTDDEPSTYMVFSSAFLFLLRLWKFYRPPLEQYIAGGGAFGSELSLEYLLLLCNSHIASNNSATQNEINTDSVRREYASDKPIYIDLYPKLRAWYCQNNFCIDSPLSGPTTGNPVHQVANKIINMIYSKMTKGGSSLGNSPTLSNNSICGSPSSTGEDPYQRLMLPAWEVLEAIPFVLEAILTACAHGRLSSRDLTTGLRDLIDFLPASIGAIITYFSAEITRGTWKLVPMNGTDWPSPAAFLLTVESEIKEILDAAGVDFPSCSGPSPVMLPLPMAVLVSLTITFKLSKNLEYIHAVVGPALENCASCCPWPSIPIIGALWAQKVRRWHQFIVVSCARGVFGRNTEAVAQLLRSCFSSFLGSLNFSTSLLTDQSSVSGLLGSNIAVPGVCASLAPGFLYLRSCRTIHNVQYVSDVILGLVAEYARESAKRWASTDSCHLKSSHVSLSIAAAKAREVAMLGASLLCVSGGLHLVQEFYRETIPTWLLSSREEKLGEVSALSRILEGYAMACMLILAGSFVWSIGERSPPWAFSRRARIVGVHMDFLARVLEGNISLGCHPTTWKTYVSSLVGLMVSFTPAWIQEVKLETLRKLASGLRGWHEWDLAISLLERGGVSAIGSVVELVNVIN